MTESSSHEQTTADTIQILTEVARRTRTTGEGENTKIEQADLAVMHARLGAMLASKGLTADQVAAFVRDRVQPLMNDLLDRAGRGEDIGNLQFVIQRADQTAK